jgi:hypothetical protein
MRYAIFGALILSLELFGVSFATAAMPANDRGSVNAGAPKDLIQVMAGCGWHQKPNRKTGKCESI